MGIPDDSRLLFLGICLIVAIVALASVDSAAVGHDDPLLLPKFGIVAVPDTLAAAVFAVCGIYLHRFTKALGSLRYLIRGGVCGLLLITFGAFRGFAIGLPHVSGIGPEARGLFFTWIVVALCAIAVIYRPMRFSTLIVTLAVLALIRDCVELLLYGSLMDVSQGTLSAIVATVIQSYVVLKRGRAWRLLLLSLPLDVFVLTSSRRTPIIELALGVVFTCVIAIMSRRASIQTRLAAALTVPVFLGIAALIDSAFLDGRLTERVLSLDPRDSSQAETSNFEHRRDVEESFDLAMESPFFGLGTGTRLPERFLTKYDEDVPIHSPHLNSWVRFGIAGLVAYTSLQIAILVWLFRISVSRRATFPFVNEEKAALIGCCSYLWGQWALPPFYASDYKQALCLGSLLGIALGLEVVVRRCRKLSRKQLNLPLEPLSAAEGCA